MKKILVFIIVFLAGIPLSSGFVSAATATEITNCGELQDMKNNLAGDYVLMNDIDCSDTVNWNDGKGFEPIGGLVGSSWICFRGLFDGQGHIITGLYINRPSTVAVGLFGCLDHTSIKNVGLIDVDITGADLTGALWGYSHYGTASNCYSTGSVTGISAVGGLVGNVFHGKVTNCYSTGNVNGNTYVGGLTGLVCDGDVINSYSTGNVNGNIGVGGLVGLDGCGHYSYIRNSYSTGNVNGNIGVGGLFGSSGIYTQISNSYSTGSVTGNSDVGGLVGSNSGTITNSYWDISTSGTIDGVGNQDPDPIGVVGKTTTQMLQQSTYVGWDFVNIWAIDEGVTYPYEIWQTKNYPLPPVLALIEELALPQGTETSLVSTINNAMKSLEKGNEGAAVNQLQAFINKVEAQRGKKISEEAADMLIAYADIVIAQIKAG